jgi:epoxyqueuosine reductase
MSQVVRRAAAEAGFDKAGIAPLGPHPELNYFSDWIEAGYSGEMAYLETRDSSGRLRRSSLDAVAPWARSVVVCVLNYNTEQPYSNQVPEDTGRGWISRYAWSTEDYHRVVLNRLRRVEEKLHREFDGPLETRSYVDTGPLVERVWARYAGVGWIGKNTCIIDQKLGSWLFLGVILTSLELEPDTPPPDRCGSCTRCLDVCPTEAFVGPYQLDASRCISYLTIEKRGEIPQALRAGMGRHVFGCDLCQDVCPWNRKAPATSAAELQPRPELVHPTLEWLASLTEEEFREVFRGSPLKRAKRSGLRRNAVIAMGNSGDLRFLPLLRGMTQDQDAVVAGHARWALERLLHGGQQDPASKDSGMKKPSQKPGRAERN